jgi:Clp amino terminal domain, pathogenicity island component
MFERFTDKARTAVILARTEASERGDQIRPAYLLHALASGEGVAAGVLADLGVDPGDIERRLDRIAPLRKPLGGEPPGADAEALASIGIDLDEIRRKVEENFGPGALERAPASSQGTGRITMTREAKQSVELAAKEARTLRHSYIGTEHLLLGLLGAAERNPRGDFSAETVGALGIDPAQVRQRILDVLRSTSA